MSTIADKPSVATVDFLVDEQGNRIDMRKETPIRVAVTEEEAVGATGPSAWWLYGLVALAIVVAILLTLQWINGNPQTDVIPGTPITAPETNVPVPVS